MALTEAALATMLSSLGNIAGTQVNGFLSNFMNTSRIKRIVGKDAYKEGMRTAWSTQNGLDLSPAQRMSMDWQEQQAATAWEREMAFERDKYSIQTQSMKDAGVNPAMVYGGGNLVSTMANGQQAQAPSMPTAGSPFSDLISMITELSLAGAQMSQMNAQTKLIKAETEGKSIDNEIKEETKSSVIAFTKLSVDERQAAINEALARTENENQKYALYELDKANKALTNEQLALVVDWYDRRQEAEIAEIYSRIDKNDAEAVLTMAKAGLIPYERALLVAEAYYYNEVGEHAGDKNFEQWLVGSFGEELSDFIHNLIEGKTKKNPKHRNRDTERAVEEAIEKGEDISYGIQLAREGQ